MSDVMQLLADEWVIGTVVLSVVVVAIHLVFSIRLILNSRKIGYDVGTSGMIPLINLFVWIKKCHIKRASNKTIKEDAIIEL